MAESNAPSKEFSLDMSLDDIDDLPAFKVFPSGAYLVTLINGFEEKEIEGEKGKHKALQLDLRCDEVMEMSEALTDGEVAPIAGDIMSMNFLLDNKFGIGLLKEVLKPLGEKLGTANVGQIMQQAKGMQILAVVHRKYNKEKDRFYGNLKKIQVL